MSRDIGVGERYSLPELCGRTITTAYIERDQVFGDVLILDFQGQQVMVIASNYIGAPSELDIETVNG